jgi:VanZ family protein
MTFNQRFARYWLPVIAVMTFIYWMSTDAFSARNTYRFIDPVIRFFAPLLSRKEIYFVHSVIRKAAHVIEYFILGVMLFRAFRAGSKERLWMKWSATSLLVVAFYAAADEIHQAFVSTRTSSALDIGIDAMGGLLAQFFSILWYRRFAQRND